MTSNKEKSSQHGLPNRELARVFNFTSEDLAANRLSFLTREQQWNIPILLRPITHRIFSILPVRQRKKVDHMCGRIDIQQTRVLHPNRSGSYDYGYGEWQYILTVSGGYGVEFPLTDEQFSLLSNYLNIEHHIYYIFRGGYHNRIIAIEQAQYAC